jgi:tetratricopeptide (TPR) repeat protein
VLVLLPFFVILVTVARMLRPAARQNRAWRRGFAAAGDGRHAEAEKYFRVSAALAERNFGARERWRTAHHLALLAESIALQDRLPEAEELLARALATRPAQIESRTAPFAWVYVVAAELASLRQDPGRMVKMLEEGRAFARAGEPKALAQIDLARATLLSESGDDERALELLRSLDRRHVPNSEAARLGRLLLKAGDGPGAVDLLRRAVEIERRRADLSNELAELRSLVAEGLELTGRRSEAQVALTMALDTHDALGAPAAATVPLLIRLARVELALGDRAAARDACRRALALVPERAPPTEPYRSVVEDALASSRDEAERLLGEASQAGAAAAAPPL